MKTNHLGFQQWQADSFDQSRACAEAFGKDMTTTLDTGLWPARDALELLEAAVWTEIMEAAPSWAGASVRREGGFVFLQARNLTPTMFNRAIWVEPAPVTGAAIDRAVERIADCEARRCALQIQPSRLGEEARLRLAARGWAERDAWVKTWRRVEGSEVATERPQSDRRAATFRIEEIDSYRRLDFGRAATSGFGLPGNFVEWFGALVGAPGWAHFVAYAQRDGVEVPAAAGALRVEGRWGWLGIGATDPEFRRQGAQGALIAARVAAARRLGCTRLCTETGKEPPGVVNHSLNNMLRAGFEVTYLRPNFCAVD